MTKAPVENGRFRQQAWLGGLRLGRTSDSDVAAEEVLLQISLGNDGSVLAPDLGFLLVDDEGCTRSGKHSKCKKVASDVGNCSA